MRFASFALFCLTLAAQDRSLEKASVLGKQLAEDVRRSTTLVENQVVQDYVAQLGARLTAQLRSPALGYIFSTVSTDQSNALHEPLAIPGGYIFVPASLLLTANDETEFAGMLAQAIARESLLSSQTSAAQAAGTIPVIFIDSFLSNAPLPVAVTYQRRAMELQADTIAALAMSHAGFDPAALVRYIDRLQPLDQPRSPFPVRAERIAALQKAIRNLLPAAYSESDEFYAIQEQVRPLRPPPPTLFRKSDPPK